MKGIFRSLIAASIVLFILSCSPSDKETVIAPNLSVDTLFFARFNNAQSAGWVYDSTGEIGTVMAFSDRYDSLLFYDERNAKILFSIDSLPQLESRRRKVFFNVHSDEMLIADADYSEFTHMYRFNLRTGGWVPIYFPKSFDGESQGLGFSAEGNFFMDSLLIASFSYPRIQTPLPDEDSNSVWNIPHKGVFVMRNDSLVWKKSFAEFSLPAAGCTWSHFQYSYDFSNDEIFVSAPWDPEVKIYDFKGEHLRSVRLDHQAFDLQYWLIDDRSLCTPDGMDYSREVMTHFGKAGFLRDCDCYFRVVMVGDPAFRENRTELVLYDATGKLLYSEEVCSEFSGSDVFGDVINIYPLSSYDSPSEKGRPVMQYSIQKD